MSLIVTSSAQQDLGGIATENRTRTKAGIESPAQYQNHFTSPVKIPANSEIAVESVKIRRDALVEVENDTLMYHYFGHLQEEADSPNYKDARVEMPIAIRPEPGSYNVEEWTTEIQTRLNEAYGNPEIFNNYLVASIVNTSGKVVGLDIQSSQRGVSTGAGQNRAGASNVDEMLSAYWVAPYQLSDGYVHTTDWTSTHTASAGGVPAHKLFTRVKANNASDDTVLKKLNRRECSVIGHGHPFGLVQGKYKVNVTGSNGSDSGWRVGLSRPQIEYVRDTTRTPSRGRANLLPGTRHPEGGFDDQVAISTKYNMTNMTNERNQKDYYDYMVEDDGININIYQLSYDNTEGFEQLVQSEVEYWGSGGEPFTAKLTKAQFNASFAAVEFKSHGDEIRLSFLNASDAETVVVSSAIDAGREKCFLPISECKNALYPRLNVAVQNDTLQVFHWSSHYDVSGYRYPSFDATNNIFTTGDDFYSNNRVGRFQRGKIGGDNNKAIVRDTKNRPYCLSQTLACDTKERLQIAGDTETRTSFFDGELAGNKGIDKKHLFVIGFVEPGTVNDYLEGRYRTTETSGRAKMNRIIGFLDKSTIDQVEGAVDGYVAVNSHGDVVQFQSYDEPDYRVNSAFVRVSNMPIQSYNGAKQSVSKILYHLPRFTNDGREFGDLFFAPGEKTYVSLHNPSDHILNNIEVQIVDVNERPVTDISGNTVIVLHVRPKM